MLFASAGVGGTIFRAQCLAVQSGSRVLCLPTRRVPLRVVCRCTGTGTDSGRETAENTRIRWGSPDEGWICLSDSDDETSDFDSSEVDSSGAGGEALSKRRPRRKSEFIDLLTQAADSHYRFLELTPDADADEIKAAYRRLSKLYHPDTTSLPLEMAAENFVKLKKAYDVLSSQQDRRFYDWQLAQELSKRKGGEFIWPNEIDQNPDWRSSWTYDAKMKVEDKDGELQEHLDPVDRLGGRNMDLSSGAQAALSFDILVIIVSVCSIIYAYLKQHHA